MCLARFVRVFSGVPRFSEQCWGEEHEFEENTKRGGAFSVFRFCCTLISLTHWDCLKTELFPGVIHMCDARGDDLERFVLPSRTGHHLSGNWDSLVTMIVNKFFCETKASSGSESGDKNGGEGTVTANEKSLNGVDDYIDKVILDLCS